MSIINLELNQVLIIRFQFIYYNKSEFNLCSHYKSFTLTPAEKKLATHFVIKHTYFIKRKRHYKKLEVNKQTRHSLSKNYRGTRKESMKISNANRSFL